MEIRLTGIEQVGLFEDLWDTWWPDRAAVLTGEAIADDARDRIENDETAPDGSRWEPWSDNPPGRGYASTRGPEHKLLKDEGDLADSITFRAQSAGFVVGSELSYALVHQFGGDRIPARPYAGVSDELERSLDVLLERDLDAAWSLVARMA